jgi:hypothetical protein
MWKSTFTGGMCILKRPLTISNAAKTLFPPQAARIGQAICPQPDKKILFFPALWSEEEKAEWGKGSFIERFRQEVEAHWRLSPPTNSTTT